MTRINRQQTLQALPSTPRQQSVSLKQPRSLDELSTGRGTRRWTAGLAASGGALPVQQVATSAPAVSVKELQRGARLSCGPDQPTPTAPPVGEGGERVDTTLAPTERLEALLGEGVLPEDFAEQYGKLSEDEQQMYYATIDQLEQFTAGEISSSDYMINVMREAAQIAGPDAGQFKDLLEMSFSEVSGDWDLPRFLAGAPVHDLGQYLEMAYQNNGGAEFPDGHGFNPNVLDVRQNNSVTHHFGAFLGVASHGIPGVGAIRDLVVDASITALGDRSNPGDVRSSYYAEMIAQGLDSGDITPAQAVQLTEWAWTTRLQDEGWAAPPWGTEDSGTHVTREDFDLDVWLQAYAAASPCP